MCIAHSRTDEKRVQDAVYTHTLQKKERKSTKICMLDLDRSNITVAIYFKSYEECWCTVSIQQLNQSSWQSLPSHLNAFSPPKRSLTPRRAWPAAAARPLKPLPGWTGRCSAGSSHTLLGFWTAGAPEHKETKERGKQKKGETQSLAKTGVKPSCVY